MMQEKRLAWFNRAYKIIDTGLLELPEDLSDFDEDAELEGDCQTYCRTVKNIVGAKFAVTFRCFSTTSNPRWLPRHAVLWVKGMGWIDSSNRKWRNSPLPNCIPIWPVGFPLIVFTIYSVAVWYGYYPPLPF
jgi:hypothetical protein